MDFSSLDLLASTALRDNSQSQADRSASVLHSTFDHDSAVDNDEDDDDEPDGEKDVAVLAADSVGLPAPECYDMGSVKIGKNRKGTGNTNKPVLKSIFVKDGKYVTKKVSGAKEDGSVGLSDAVGTKEAVELCCNNNSVPDKTEISEDTLSVLASQTEIHLCNGKDGAGLNSSLHSEFAPRATQNGDAGLSDNDADFSVTETHCHPQDVHSQVGKAALEDAKDCFVSKQGVELDLHVINSEVSNPSCESQTREETLNTTETGDSACMSETDTEVTNILCHVKSCPPHSHNACSPEQVQDRVSEQLSGLQKKETQSLSSCLSTKEASDLNSNPADLSSGNTLTSSSSASSTQALNLEEGAADSSSTQKDSVKKETINCDNCDENRALLAALPNTFPLTSFSLLPSSSTLTSATANRETSPSRDNLDQDTGSSGNNDINPSTNTFNTTSSPLHPPLSTETESADTVLLDHCYFCSSDKLGLGFGQSVENTDDSGDAFESADENVSADDIERRPRSLSVDSEYLQYGVPGTATGQTDKTLLSPTLSVDSISNDSSMSEHSAATGAHFYSILTGGQPPARGAVSTVSKQRLSTADGTESPAASSEALRLTTSLLDTGAGGPKCGKFRIGTFGSFSNSHLDLEGDGKKLKIGIPSSDTLMKSSMSSPALASPGSPFPLLQSPGMEWDRSDAGSEAPDDLDSSTTEDKFLSSSHDSESYFATGQVWNHPVFHDHDYCCKEVSEKLGKPITSVRGGKRKNTRKKERLEAAEEEKLKKGKYLKMELLKQDNRFNLAGGGGLGGNGMDSRALAARSSLLAESLTSKPNPVGRPRKRFEKQVEEYDAETGTKMKITGKYQDQYVYYYSKTSRNRRRKVDDKTPSGDKIILPPSKPGDIVVPHLTDADCEAIRKGGRAAFKGGNGSSFSLPHHSSGAVPHADQGDMMDSSIVNTILSMESDNLATSPMGSNHGDGDFGGIEENLTTEQVDLLLDCLKDVEVATTSQALDSILTSAEPVPLSSSYLDSLAGTTVEGDFLVPGLPLSTPSSLPTVSGADDTPLKSEAGVSSVKTVTVPEQSPPSFIKQESMAGDIKPEVSSSLPVISTSQPSVEKNLEFLKNPDIKPDFFPVPVSGSSSPPSSSFVSVSQSSSPSSEVETPWIVTVTLYWNDIPAIIINNTPYVRLVDIHRQILPAKDTGILKKRCQLMHIQVSNCSEMQRYFLVQYGRAHNSKSTLVISKDEAWRLISYYANPQPRNLRGEEGTVMRRSSSYAELQSFMAGSGGRGQHLSSAPAFAHPRKRGGFRRRNTPTRSRNTSPEAVVAAVTPQDMDQPPPSPLAAEPASPSKRLRHKKINFLEMLKGEDSAHHAASPAVEGSLADDDSSSREEASIKPAKHNKRRGSKDPGEGSPAKRGRMGRQHSEEMKKILLGATADKQPAETEISVDSDTPDGNGDSSKGKKRSPGSSTVASLGTASQSPKSKLGPIKVNVKSLVHAVHPASSHSTQPRKKNLFGRKSLDSPVSDAAEGELPSRPLRVLRISHQAAEAASPRQDSSPVAEVHLDLYKRATSPCVRCGTCEQYLSVPGFLKHHHAADRYQSLLSAKRTIVPMNKENISAQEQQLWNEFVGLHARLDHSVSAVSMGTYPLSPQGASEADPRGCEPSREAQHQKAGLVAALPHSRPDQEPTQKEGGGVGDIPGSDSHTVATVCDDAPSAHPSSDSPWEPQVSVCSPPPLPLPGTHTDTEEKLVMEHEKKTHSVPKKTAPSKKQPTQHPKRETILSNVRTSARKRKRKQFYGFENYDFAAGGKRGGRGDGDAQDSEVDVTGTTPQDQVSVNGLDSSPNPLVAQTYESVNE